MTIVDKLEDTLKGGYNGLYGEVVTCDTYRLRQLKFTPDVIFDIGANVGIFTRFARELFPQAKIVAVEPNPENCIHFRKFTEMDEDNTILLEAALGKGPIYHGTGALNGAHETYLPAGLGYPMADMEAAVEANQRLERASVRSMMLGYLMWRYCRPWMKSVVKIDCEGAENCIWEHEPSMRSLKAADYICIEVHTYALNGALLPEVLAKTHAALHSLEATHDCQLEGVYFWATKKA